MTALVDRYLAELGLERPAADAAGLAALHAAHVHRFAHDTIWISRGRVPELDAEAFAEALVAGEGGGCIQLTGGFAWLLEQLGFEVELHGARVQRPFDRAPGGPWHAHITVQVVVDGVRYYADPGLGSALELPVPLAEGPIEQGPFRYALAPSPGGGAWIFTHDPKMMSVRAIEVSDEPSPLSAWHDVYVHDTTSPDSPYVKSLSAGIRRHDQVSILMGRTLIRLGSGRRRVEPIKTPEEFGSVLREEFRLGLPGLTPDGLDALWAKA